MWTLNAVIFEWITSKTVDLQIQKHNICILLKVPASGQHDPAHLHVLVKRQTIRRGLLLTQSCMLEPSSLHSAAHMAWSSSPLHELCCLPAINMYSEVDVAVQNTSVSSTSWLSSGGLPGGRKYKSSSSPIHSCQTASARQRRSWLNRHGDH